MKQHPTSKHSQPLSRATRLSGFTMVELLVTVAVSAILLSIAVPSFTNMVQNNRLTAQANQFIITLNYARSEAIKRGATIDVIATNDTAANEWGGGWKVAINGGADLKVFPALDGSSTLNSPADITTFSYLANGRATVTEAFALCDDRSGETGRQISISTTGRADTSDLACA